MTLATPDDASLKPPVRPLTARLFDLVVWGGVILLLLISFKPAHLDSARLLFTNSQNMREFLQDFAAGCVGESIVEQDEVRPQVDGGPDAVTAVHCDVQLDLRAEPEHRLH